MREIDDPPLDDLHSGTRRLRIAWLALFSSLVAWILLTRLGGLVIGAIGWSLVATVLALGTARQTSDKSWQRRPLWLLGATLVLVVVSTVPADVLVLVWIAYVLYMPARIAAQATRALRSRGEDSVLHTWVIAAAYRIILVAAAALTQLPNFVDISDSEDAIAIQNIAGCYSATLTPWIPPSMAGHSQQGVIPSLLRLDTTRGPSHAVDESRRLLWEEGRRLIRPRWAGASTWTASSHRAIRLVWTNGFHGVTARLVRIGDSFVGPADAFTDTFNGQPEPTAWLLLRPTPCDRVPRDSVQELLPSPIDGT